MATASAPKQMVPPRIRQATDRRLDRLHAVSDGAGARRGREAALGGARSSPRDVAGTRTAAQVKENKNSTRTTKDKLKLTNKDGKQNKQKRGCEHVPFQAPGRA